MSFTKNYYHILGLNPNTASLSAADLRRAYKGALLGAHPDKWGLGGDEDGNKDGPDGRGGGVVGTQKQQQQQQQKQHQDIPTKQQHQHQHQQQQHQPPHSPPTIDDIKEAYTILSTPHKKRQYDIWFLHNTHLHNSNPTHTPTSSSLLGLEALDLADFEPRPAAEAGQELWTRACRCGAEQGFSISEAELEGAVEGGEREVLVGCVGCSLWVRVGFDVEDEGEEEEEEEG